MEILKCLAPFIMRFTVNFAVCPRDEEHTPDCMAIAGEAAAQPPTAPLRGYLKRARILRSFESFPLRPRHDGCQKYGPANQLPAADFPPAPRPFAPRRLCAPAMPPGGAFHRGKDAPAPVQRRPKQGTRISWGNLAPPAPCIIILLIPPRWLQLVSVPHSALPATRTKACRAQDHRDGLRHVKATSWARSTRRSTSPNSCGQSTGTCCPRSTSAACLDTGTPPTCGASGE